MWSSECVGRCSLSVTFDELPTKLRHRVNFKHSSTYNPKANETNEGIIRDAFEAAYGKRWEHWEGEVRVSIIATREVAKRATLRSIGQAVLMEPDVDNTAKLVLDALNGTAWHDDKQVTELHVKRARKGARGQRASIDIEICYYEDKEA